MVMKELIRCDEETQKTFLTEVRRGRGVRSLVSLLEEGGRPYEVLTDNGVMDMKANRFRTTRCYNYHLNTRLREPSGALQRTDTLPEHFRRLSRVAPLMQLCAPVVQVLPSHSNTHPTSQAIPKKAGS